MADLEQGKLALDDSIRKHVPELPEYVLSVTLRRHLLHHTSGVRDYLASTIFVLSDADSFRSTRSDSPPSSSASSS